MPPCKFKGIPDIQDAEVIPYHLTPCEAQQFPANWVIQDEHPFLTMAFLKTALLFTACKREVDRVSVPGWL